MTALLEVRDLSVSYATEQGEVAALDRVSFAVPRGHTVALVGESGCGKSTAALSILRLLPESARQSGAILFQGRDLTLVSPRELRKVRGGEIGMVFQDPATALNPLYTVGAQLIEAIRLHERVGRAAARERAMQMLERVGFPEPRARFDDYPHELSGGMCQRVMIAIALACGPALLVADEPTTALDLLAAAQIAALLGDLRRDSELSLLLVTHDLALVADLADTLVVLYAGQVVERGAAPQLLAQPQHPYLRALCASVPPIRKTPRRRRATPTRLPAIAGTVPAAGAWPSGCRFAARCPEAYARCDDAPVLEPMPEDRAVRCWLHSEEAG